VRLFAKSWQAAKAASNGVEIWLSSSSGRIAVKAAKGSIENI
jgi:hypothetical protein